jgi:hypothetical protein
MLLDIYADNADKMAVFSKFMENAIYLILVAFFLFFGVIYLNKWRNKENFEVKRKLNLGYFFFFWALGIGVGIFAIDRVAQFISEVPHDRWINSNVYPGIFGYTGTPEWSAINRDYILFTLIGLIAGFVFLTYVVEKYILSRKVILSWVCVAGLVLAIVLRPLETYLINSSGGDIYNDATWPDYVEFIGYILYAIMALVLILIFVIYGKIAGSAPRGSDLANRSVAVIVGLLVIIAMLLGLSNQFSGIDPGGDGFFYGVHMLGPAIALVGLFILNYGFTEKK